jgi:hypothetical protein
MKKFNIFNLDVDLRYFCEIEILNPLFSYEVMSNILGDHLFYVIIGNHIRGSNLVETLSINIIVTRMNVQTSKPWGVDERLNPQCGEVQC